MLQRRAWWAGVVMVRGPHTAIFGRPGGRCRSAVTQRAGMRSVRLRALRAWPTLAAVVLDGCVGCGSTATRPAVPGWAGHGYGQQADDGPVEHVQRAEPRRGIAEATSTRCPTRVSTKAASAASTPLRPAQATVRGMQVGVIPNAPVPASSNYATIPVSVTCAHGRSSEPATSRTPRGAATPGPGRGWGRRGAEGA